MYDNHETSGNNCNNKNTNDINFNFFTFNTVGYSTCHWCHVMERESFESEEIAQILNDKFVSVKVDREERPDVDKVYMTYIQVYI